MEVPSQQTSGLEPEVEQSLDKLGEDEPATELTLTEGIKTLLDIQERRAEAYAQLRSSFLQYLSDEDEKAYKITCGEITVRFNSLSSQVRKLESQLKARDNPEGHNFAAQIRKLQEFEQTKLQMTCTLQVLRRAHEATAWEWQNDGPLASSSPPPPPPPSAGGPPRLQPRSWRRCNCNEAGCEIEAADPTREEYHAAVAEATQALEESVCGVNEILEELKYELEDD